MTHHTLVQCLVRELREQLVKRWLPLSSSLTGGSSCRSLTQPWNANPSKTIGFTIAYDISTPERLLESQIVLCCREEQ